MFDDLLSAFMVDLWLYKATCIKYGMSQILELWVLELYLLPEQLYWHCCEYRAREIGIASISLPSAALVLHCHEQLGDWIMPWMRSLMWQ